MAEINIVDLLDMWKNTFGEELAFGFEITESDTFLIVECLKEKDQTKINELISERVSRDVLY